MDLDHSLLEGGGKQALIQLIDLNHYEHDWFVFFKLNHIVNHTYPQKWNFRQGPGRACEVQNLQQVQLCTAHDATWRHYIIPCNRHKSWGVISCAIRDDKRELNVMKPEFITVDLDGRQIQNVVQWLLGEKNLSWPDMLLFMNYVLNWDETSSQLKWFISEKFEIRSIWSLCNTCPKQPSRNRWRANLERLRWKVCYFNDVKTTDNLKDFLSTAHVFSSSQAICRCSIRFADLFMEIKKVRSSLYFLSKEKEGSKEFNEAHLDYYVFYVLSEKQVLPMTEAVHYFVSSPNKLMWVLTSTLTELRWSYGHW